MFATICDLKSGVGATNKRIVQEKNKVHEEFK